MDIQNLANVSTVVINSLLMILKDNHVDVNSVVMQLSSNKDEAISPEVNLGELTQQTLDELQKAKAQKVAVPETPKRQGGYYIRDLRKRSGNSMRFWYQDGYGTKHKNFFWCATLEEAKKYQSGCDWFEIWHAPYIDSLIEHTVDFQLADRSVGFVDLKAQEQTDLSKFDGYTPIRSRKEQVG